MHCSGQQVRRQRHPDIVRGSCRQTSSTFETHWEDGTNNCQTTAHEMHVQPVAEMSHRRPLQAGTLLWGWSAEIYCVAKESIEHIHEGRHRSSEYLILMEVQPTNP